jgi:hypothetical protein
MARFKFHSAIEEILVEEFDCEHEKAIKAVQKAADSGEQDLDFNNLDSLSEAIYSTQKYWE